MHFLFSILGGVARVVVGRANESSALGPCHLPPAGLPSVRSMLMAVPVPNAECHFSGKGRGALIDNNDISGEGEKNVR